MVKILSARESTWNKKEKTEKEVRRQHQVLDRTLI